MKFTVEWAEEGAYAVMRFSCYKQPDELSAASMLHYNTCKLFQYKIRLRLWADSCTAVRELLQLGE